MSTTTTTTTTSTKSSQRLTLFLKPSVIKHSRATAIIEGITLTQLVEKALIEYLPEEIVLKKSGKNKISKKTKITQKKE